VAMSVASASGVNVQPDTPQERETITLSWVT
jgi:hypothetical protein